LSIRPHQALQTHMADLGQMDLAIWNTAHGRFVQEIKGERISTRLTDHVELIFVPVSLVFWLWDDVRALLVLQSAVIALGAWPVFRIACSRLRRLVDEGLAEWASLAFVLAYLLFPALEAANMAEFHAVPLAVLPILLALWWVEEGAWGRFAIAALTVAAVKEDMALLAVMLGLWATARALRSSSGSAKGRWMGLAVAAAAALWFAVATFVIIPAHAEQAYGVAEFVYVRRYGELGNSVADIVRSLLTRPGLVWSIATEPERLRYVAGLLAGVGGLAALAPEIVLLSAPALAANLLSAYPAQYSGELHYSAPLVPYIVVAAIVGAARATGWLGRALHERRGVALGLVLAWLLAWSLGYHRAKGWTPLGGEFRWPEITEHHQLAERFFRQIPKDAPVSATTALYPHLSHRERIYKFPALGDASYVLLEVNGATDMHPVELRRRFDELLASGRFCILDAADGFILLGPPRGECVRELPDAFYSFARAQGRLPTYPTNTRFEDLLRLAGYDVIDDPKWRLTSVRLYVEVLTTLPQDIELWPFFVDADGEVAEDPVRRPPVAPLWYPPERWRPGEVVLVETLPWFLPDRWALALGVARGGSWAEPVNRVRVSKGGGAYVVDGTWAVFSPFIRDGGILRPLTEADWPSPWRDRRWTFGAAIELIGARVPERVAPGETLWFDLLWQVTEPIPRAYTVFVHLRDGQGRRVAQRDAQPAWFGPVPTTRWGPDPQPDAHRLEIPQDLEPGEYTLVIGLYDLETGERLPVRDETGAAVGDEVQLAVIQVR
ncbi:MAG TPA: DUF2079 domain-containing protein, partial [Caldilineae bacterium]|nr:DUF2079 domain-containing protein [Caldilineae bacterium]